MIKSTYFLLCATLVLSASAQEQQAVQLKAAKDLVSVEQREQQQQQLKDKLRIASCKKDMFGNYVNPADRPKHVEKPVESNEPVQQAPQIKREIPVSEYLAVIKINTIDIGNNCMTANNHTFKLGQAIPIEVEGVKKRFKLVKLREQEIELEDLSDNKIYTKSIFWSPN